MSQTSIQLTDLTVIEGDAEPRILDLRIAERLGYAVPRDIRKIIRRSVNELTRHGILCHRGTNTGERGRPAHEFWLNEAQAILICMKSETTLAADVRAEIIAVFQAYRRGHLVPSSPITADVLGSIFDEKLAPVHHSISDIRRSQETISSKLDQHGMEIQTIGTNVVQISRRVDDIVPRHRFSAYIEQQYRETCLQEYQGKCPCCKDRRIVNDDGTKTDELHYDHFNGRELVGAGDGWCVCKRCNLRLRDDDEFKNSKRVRFAVFHDDRRRLFGPSAQRPRKSANGKTIEDPRQGGFFLHAERIRDA
jgi:hypothetical protein